MPNTPTPAPPLPPAPDLNALDPLIGSTLGSFKIVRVVGKGGMGTVYLGEQTVIGSKVAIKILHSHLASNASLVQRFYAEARAVNLIGHENIVNIFDMNVVPPDRYYLIMEFLEGRPLSHALRSPMAPEVAIPILLQVCDALQSAHAARVVHRDLKPENIYLLKRGRKDNFVKILDFGIAKLFATELNGETTNVGTIVGTPEYMAPEQTTGDAIDGRSDIYSLGVIAYLMAVGRLPFSGGGLAGLLIAHQQKVPVAPVLANPRVPEEWSRVIMKALAKRPGDRFPDADSFGTALADVLGALPQHQTPPPGMRPPSVAGWPAQSLTPPGAGTPSSPAVATPVSTAPARTPAPAPSMAVAAAVPPAVLPPASSVPAHARHEARFDAMVTLGDGRAFGSLPCRDISKGGMFLCTEGAAPAVFSRLSVRLPIAGDLDFVCEVVRHVTADQANAWGMSQGFGVQFLELNVAQREALGRVVQGLPVAQAAAAPVAHGDEAHARTVLDKYAQRINGDHYVVLGVAPDCELSDARAHGRELSKELEALKQRPISPRQLEMVTAALLKVHEALQVIGSAHKRIEYDARRKNYRGVARCIAAGVTVADIDAARRRFLNDQPGAETHAHVKFVTGNAYENKGVFPTALENYEAALNIDPLNLRIQQRYWALKRRIAEPARGP